MMPGQAGEWVKGTPEYIPPARIYMLASLLFGYLGSAVLYFMAVPAINRDIAKREDAVRAGNSLQVCAVCGMCSRGACTLTHHLDALLT